MVELTPFPWWTDAQKQLADELQQHLRRLLPQISEANWRQQICQPLLDVARERSWFGALVGEKWGGFVERTGVTGGVIVSEALRAGGQVGMFYTITAFGGAHQLEHFGTDDQKRRWLAPLARGEMFSAVCITEPLVGSDANSIALRATQTGDGWNLRGRKRFITNAGHAGIFLVYALTDPSEEARKRRRHLSAFIVPRGAEGFHLERVNPLAGWDGIVNAYLDFNDARIPADHLLGKPGDGWAILTGGLNIERTLGSIGAVSMMGETLRYAKFHADRRVQFGKPTSSFQMNQSRLSDIWMRYFSARLRTYYTAYLIDQGQEPVMEATACKILNSEAATQSALDAVSAMGGDGWTRFYPVERFMRDGKIGEIGAGSNDILRTFMLRFGGEALGAQFPAPMRLPHPDGFPVEHTAATIAEIPDAGNLLKVLADDYRVNAGIGMYRTDIERRYTAFGTGKTDAHASAALDGALRQLLSEGLAEAISQRPELFRVSDEGLRKYTGGDHARLRYTPDWFDKDLLF